METHINQYGEACSAPLRRAGAAWFVALATALVLSACGGSGQTPQSASGSVDNTSGGGAAAVPASSTAGDPAASSAAATTDQAASEASPAGSASDAVAAGFQVGTTTFDSALPPEPALPTAAQICASLPATLTAQPNGLLPDSADAANTAPDTARIQAALTACTNASSTGLATNKAVRLTSGTNGANAFLSGPLTLPSGVTLWIDRSVTLFASRDPRQYDKTRGTASCGLITASDTAATR
jgi:polygalacturonase